MEYKQGCENKVVDALFRRSDSVSEDLDALNPSINSPSLFLISFLCPSWIKELKTSYQLSTEMQQLLAQLQSGLACPRFFSLHNAQILYKGRVYLGPQCSLKPKVLHLVHDNSLGGHFGFFKSFYD